MPKWSFEQSHHFIKAGDFDEGAALLGDHVSNALAGRVASAPAPQDAAGNGFLPEFFEKFHERAIVAAVSNDDRRVEAENFSQGFGVALFHTANILGVAFGSEKEVVMKFDDEGTPERGTGEFGNRTVADDNRDFFSERSEGFRWEVVEIGGDNDVVARGVCRIVRGENFRQSIVAVAGPRCFDVTLDFGISLSAIMAPFRSVDGRVSGGHNTNIGDAGFRGKFFDAVGTFVQPIGKIPGDTTTLSVDFRQPLHAKFASCGNERSLGGTGPEQEAEPAVRHIRVNMANLLNEAEKMNATNNGGAHGRAEQ